MKNKYDHALQDSLEDWRESKTAAVYGWACLNDHGPSLVMPLSILDRIVDCAHHHKLQSTQDLKREMGWTDAEKFGDEIIVLVKLHAAPCSSPFVSTPLRNTPSSTGISTPNVHTDMPSPSTPSTSLSLLHINPKHSGTKRCIKCSACGEEGHNGKLSCMSVSPTTYCESFSLQSRMQKVFPTWGIR